jgi:glucans biosynthesis protein
VPRALPLAQVIATRVGAGEGEARLIVLEFAGDNLKGIPPAEVKGMVWGDKGKVHHVVSQPNPRTGGVRLSFQLAPGGEKAVELRAQLQRGEDALSEVWLYRWTA